MKFHIGRTVEEGLEILKSRGINVEGIALPVVAHKKKLNLPPKTKELTEAFLRAWHAFSRGPEPIREHVFALPRKWRFDLAWPPQRVAVECEGGVWTLGRHSRGAGYRRDCEKYRAAVALGWRVLRFVVNDLDIDPAGVVAEVESLLRNTTNAKP